MIVLEAAQTLRGICNDATTINYAIEGMELAAGVEVYKMLAQAQLPTSAGTLYTVPASTQAFIKSLHIVNTAAAIKAGIKLFIGGAVAANQMLGELTLPANGWAVMEEGGWNIYDSKGARKLKGSV